MEDFKTILLRACDGVMGERMASNAPWEGKGRQPGGGLRFRSYDPPRLAPRPCRSATLPRGDSEMSRSSRSEFHQIGNPDLLPGAFNAAVSGDSDQTGQSSGPKICAQVQGIRAARSSKDHIPERSI